MLSFQKKLLIIILSLCLTACSSPQFVEQVEETKPILTVPIPTGTAAPTNTMIPTEVTPEWVSTPTDAATETPAPTLTMGPTPTLDPEAWKKFPVIPTGVSERTRLIYQMGLLKGNNPHAFSKVGDCNTTMPYFLGDFDTSGAYQLGEYSQLQKSIDYFSGSFSRKSLAAKDGLTAHAALSVLWVDWKDCETYETPLTCEYRIQRPAFAIISFGTNDANGGVDFEIAFRRVIDMTIGNGTVPILSTKADNAEGDNSINATIARVAYEYELPLWNFWLAVQTLPDKGMRSPEHLSASPVGFANFEGENLNYGWSIRNLTALQVLDSIRDELAEKP